jgi:hypothetical protein
VVVVECEATKRDGVQGAPCVLLVLQVRVPGSYQAGRRYQPCKVHVIKLSSFVQVPGYYRQGNRNQRCVYLG